jgi:hypothetical protein
LIIDSRANQHRNHQGRLKSAREISRDLHGQPSDKTITDWVRQDFPKVYREMNGGEPSGELARDRRGADPLHEALAAGRKSFMSIRGRAGGC